MTKTYYVLQEVVLANIETGLECGGRWFNGYDDYDRPIWRIGQVYWFYDETTAIIVRDALKARFNTIIYVHKCELKVMRE